MNNSENEIVNTLLGERISNARIAQGLTITQLAKSVGVTPKTLKNWEADRSEPRANRLNQLAGMLNISVLWLVGGIDSPPGVSEPNQQETAMLETKLQRAESLVNELSAVIVDIRAQSRRIQREFDKQL